MHILESCWVKLEMKPRYVQPNVIALNSISVCSNPESCTMHYAHAHTCKQATSTHTIGIDVCLIYERKQRKDLIHKPLSFFISLAFTQRGRIS